MNGLFERRLNQYETRQLRAGEDELTGAADHWAGVPRFDPAEELAG